MSWGADLKKIASAKAIDLNELCKAIKINLFSSVVNDTRVDTGRLRGNWQISENQKASGSLDRIDPNGSAVMAEIERGATGDGVTYFVNNLPYAAVWEEKDAMIGKNVARLRQIVREEARNL